MIIISGEKFPIRLREKHNRQSVKDGSWITSELVPNDKLAIIFDDFHGKEWVDSSSILLEDKLPQIVAFFEIRAVQEKEDRKKQEIRQREYERELEIERKIKAEKVLDWIKWAKTKVDKIDPLSDGVDEFVEGFWGESTLNRF